jgi:glycosyltransferase involved in cell wall biosynthesis
LERWIYRQYDAVACISAETGASLAAWAPSVKSIVIGNGIDVARFASASPLERSSLGISESDTVVLMVGAFRPEKNQAVLMEAFAQLPADHSMVLAGDGAERPAVEQLADQLGVRARVRFLGAVPGVERLYKMADVYVLPSRFEGFGISALEAAAAGVPIVHSDVPGLSDMLDGAGWPVDPASAESIADGIRLAVRAGRKSGQVAHGHVVALRYGLDGTVAKHIDLYRSLIAGSSAMRIPASPRRREP